MQKFWRRVTASRASRNAAASYLAFASTAAWGLVTIPVAVSFLEREQLGLWTVVNAFLGYLVWLDLGVGPAAGRMMGRAVADRDKKEINCWWTTTRAVLLAQAVVAVVTGLLLVPLLTHLLDIPDALASEARWLLVGGVLITGCSLPMRGVPGLMTAQERFHWIPLIQAITPWVNLAVFYSLLKAGFGLRAYIYALGTSQLLTWICFNLLVFMGPDRPRFDRGGLVRERFGKLFAFSGNMTVVGLVDTVLASLPAMIITRFGGLGLVPIYNFSWKGPSLGSGLIGRTHQAFYPALQRMHITGYREGFRKKHEQVGRLTLGISLMGAGAVLIGNPILVQMLAGGELYSGAPANAWFAAAMVSVPLCGYFRALLPISGSLGKHSLVSLLKFIAGAVIGGGAWSWFGLAGLAAVFTVLPLFDGVYGYLRGTAGCGFAAHEISPSVAVLGLASIALIVFCGYLAGSFEGSLGAVLFGSRTLSLPALGSCVVSAVPMTLGVLVLLKALLSFRRSA